MEGGGMMTTDLQSLKRLDMCKFKHEEVEGVYISYAPAQKDFVEHLCVDIRRRGRHVVDVVKECAVLVAIISEEFMNSKCLKLDSAETVRFKKGEMKIIRVFLGASPEQCRDIHSRLLGVWQDWAKRSDGQEWLGALEVEVISLTDGLDFYTTSELMYRQRLVDAVCEMAPVRVGNRQIVVCSILSQLETISTIQNSMEEFRSRVGVCSTQCEHLIPRIQRQFGTMLDNITLAYLQNLPSSTAFSHYCELLSALLDRFIRNMETVEDLLYLCAEMDWKVAALSVFLPVSCDPWRSKFALVARELDWTYSMLHLEDPIAEQFPSVSRGLSVAINQDRSSVLHKLESGPSKKSVHRQMCDFLLPRSHHQGMYDALLRRRLQADASPSTPGSIPDWCWIPGKLEYSIARVVGSGSSKSVLKCQWMGMDVAIAIYKGEHAKRELETETGILASVQHPNVVTLFGCAYDSVLEEGHLVTELMELDLSQLIRKRRASRGDRQMPFSLSVSKDIIVQIVEAMMHLRKCRVLHRDLKPANCLVSAKKRIRQNDGGETYYVVKMIDFGSAKVRGPEASTCHTRKQGTTAYMAPELHAMPDECAYKWSADVYSLGMTMYEILSGRYPFEGLYSQGELVRRVCAGERPSFPECIPGMWRELIKNCWHRDPEQRYGYERIMMEILGCIAFLDF